MPIVYPANYTTSSTANTDLNGSMVLSDASTVQSYTSNAQGAATKVTNTGGTGLSFKLEFGTGANKLKYKVDATEENNGSNYDGDSNIDDPEAGPGGGVDDWEATAVPPPPDEGEC